MKLVTGVFLIMLCSGSVNLLISKEKRPEGKSKKCLTILGGKDVSVDGSVLLGHNEDLERNTCMYVEKIPNVSHREGEIWESYYGAQINQIPVTNAYVVLRVFDEDWIPGDVAGGMNEFQVAIANNLAYSKETSLRPGFNANDG